MNAFAKAPAVIRHAVWSLLLLTSCHPSPATSYATQEARKQPNLSPYSSPSVTHSEPWHTQQIATAHQWKAEVRTELGTRCDLVTDSHAIEVEWPSHWKESLTQALHYSVKLGKQPAVLFLLSDQHQSEREFVLARIGKESQLCGVEIWWYEIATQTITKEE